MPYADITKPAEPLPEPKLKEVQPGLTILSPLTRGTDTAPGIIVLVPDSRDPLKIIEGVPSALRKWSEEGYTVAEVQASAVSKDGNILQKATNAISQDDRFDRDGKIGLVAYDSSLWNKIASSLSAVPQIVGAVIYTDANNVHSLAAPQSIPTLRHIAGQQSADPPKKTDRLSKDYYYTQVNSSKFATPFSNDFHYNSENISYTRNLTFLKPRLGGPYFDIEAIWDEHCYYEFADRSVQHTMSTMVQEPYVNHVPTITGGIGRAHLTDFYRTSFIFSNSADAELELLSRTVGIDRVIDEFLFKFTHDQDIPWLLPGVPPTFKHASLPFTAVVNFRGDKLYHEHIGWDQGTALRQLGLLPEYLPFPYPLPENTKTATTNGELTNGHVNGVNGHAEGRERQVEYRVPVAGIETAEKMRDRNSVVSNGMFDFRVRYV